MSEIRREYGSAHTLAETPLGALHVWATGPDHVGVSTATSSREPGAAEHVTVNRVDYRLRVDAHTLAYLERKHADRPSWRDAWVIREGGWAVDYDGYAHCLSRVQWENVRDMYGSQSARDKAARIIVTWLGEWLEGDDGKALLEAAGQQSTAAERARLERDRAEHVTALEAIDARLAELGQS